MNIAEVQLVRKGVLGVAVIFGVLMYALTESTYTPGGFVHEAIESAGIGLIVLCIVGRTWCTLYIGGRKIDQFVTEGPYSVSRNPLYLFSILGAAGAGAQLGSILAALTFGILAWAVFHVVVLQEEKLLGGRYSAGYADYRARVPRFFPNPWQWRDAATVTVAPSLLLRTFGDALMFLLTIPVAELCEQLQSAHVLPVLLRFP